MGYYLKTDWAARYAAGDDPYYEGDQAGALDVAVPLRPSWAAVWNGSAWVDDAARLAIEAQRQAEREDLEAARVNAAVSAFINRRPAQIDAWIDAQVTTLADARTVLKLLARVLVAIARRELR